MTAPTHAAADRSHLFVLLACTSAILLITMGVRQVSGLFLVPITSSTEISIFAFSSALAIGQFMNGAAQPIFGAIADKYGAVNVLIFGGVLMAIGAALTPFLTSNLGFVFTMGVLSAAGAGAGSFSILIGLASRRVPPERRSFVAGFINAGGSAGQFIFAPLVQFLIGAAGWASAIFATAAAALLTIPLALPLRRMSAMPDALHANIGVPQTLGGQLRSAMRDRSYLCLHAGFFTCGFHVAFLTTHLPTDLELCGLPQTAGWAIGLIGLFNIFGSLGAGWLGQRYRMKHLLALIYASRAVIVAIYVLMPKTVLNVYLFAGALGLTWLATVPPTSGLVGKLFGTRYISTLFGLTLLSHQIGGFLGAGLGGLALAQLGSYEWIWYADISLAVLAAVSNLPIREAPVRAEPVPA
jgi:MFS family permease